MLSEGSYTPSQLYSAITASDCEGSAAKFNPTIVIDRAEDLE